MKVSLKDKAAAKYREIKGTLGKKLASLEGQVVQMDDKLAERVRVRREALAVTLDQAANKVRRASK